MERDIQVKDGIVTKAAERAGRVRDFIPEGEESASELIAAARKRAAMQSGRSGFRPNFIPDVADPAPRLSSEENRERNEREANESAARRSAASKQLRWEEACQQVLKMTEGQATQYIGAMPSAVRELYLLAEEATQHRPSVLRALGKVGPKSREIWNRPDPDGQVKENVPGAGIAEEIVVEEATPEERPVAIMANEPDPDPPFDDDEVSDAFAQLVPEPDEDDPEGEEPQPEEQ